MIIWFNVISDSSTTHRWYNGGPLEGPVYERLTSLTRCMHFDAFQQCLDEDTFIPHKLKSNVVSTSGVKKVSKFYPLQYNAADWLVFSTPGYF